MGEEANREVAMQEEKLLCCSESGSVEVEAMGLRTWGACLGYKKVELFKT